MATWIYPILLVIKMPLTEEELEILDKLFWKWEKTFNWDDSHVKKYTIDELGNLIKAGNGDD